MVSNIFYFHPYLGKIPILTNIFQLGWNHQLAETGCRWRCETRRPRFATQSSDAFILNACAHCLALQMIFFSSPPQGSDDFCKVLRKQLVTQLNCGNHASCKEPRNTTRCSFYRGGRNKNYGESESPRCFFLGWKKASKENHLDIFWQTQNQLENITQMHFSCGEKASRENRPGAFSGGEESM